MKATRTHSNSVASDVPAKGNAKPTPYKLCGTSKSSSAAETAKVMSQFLSKKN